MKKVCCFIALSFITLSGMSQTVAGRLTAAMQKLVADEQMKHALISLCVVNAKTGETVYRYNDQVGMAPASTQKLFTSAAAFEMLGPGYQYLTTLSYSGKDGMLNVLGSGDPSLGSWRFSGTSRTGILTRWVENLKTVVRVNGISGIRVHDGESGSLLSIPEGYIWQDIGNYYGAGTSMVNWNENQYDIRFESTAFGKSAKISSTDPPQTHVTFTNDIKAAAPGSGDNAFIFCAPFTTMAYLKGTIPAGSSFKISGAMPHASFSLAQELYGKIRAAGMMADSNLTTTSQVSGPFEKGSTVAEHKSPAFDSLNFYFLRRSVNLYGEAFVKTIAKEKTGQYSLDTGLNIIRYFWSQRGIDKSAINIADGSGLSPQNRVTADALVKVLQFARTRSWYNSFHTALPIYNGMKLKSGSIGGSRAFAGYHTSASGTTYSIAMLINNYDGSAATAVNKMFKVLDLLK